jgi:AcrR family transcriptional regulator
MRTDSRDLILQAALQLFSRQGYDGTSIDDIRRTAGFKSKASLYTHFTSKEEVARALFLQIQGNQQEFIKRAVLHASDDPLLRLVVVARAFIAWGMLYPQEYAFVFLRIQQDILVRGEGSYMITQHLGH